MNIIELGENYEESALDEIKTDTVVAYKYTTYAFSMQSVEYNQYNSRI